MKHIRKILLFLITSICFVLISCGHRSKQVSLSHLTHYQFTSLSDSLLRIAASYPAEIGISVIINNTDTVSVNDSSIYPMMSVFKLHQAVAICSLFDSEGYSIDSVITIIRDSLDLNTWSPMLKDHPEKAISVSLRDLIRYTLTCSDNNASNVMFKRFVNTESTDSLIATLIPRNSFRILYTEEEMSSDHLKAYENFTSPSGAAALINRIFTDSLMDSGLQRFISITLGECTTGRDRIMAPLVGKTGIKVAHKTGSGYKNNGILAAHNDVAYVILPNGVKYSIAVFVKDLCGDESMASGVISHISSVVYDILSQSK